MGNILNPNSANNSLTFEVLVHELAQVDLEASCKSNVFSSIFNAPQYKQTQETIDKYLKSISANCGSLSDEQKKKIASILSMLNKSGADNLNRNLLFLSTRSSIETRTSIHFMRSHLAVANQSFTPICRNGRYTAEELQQQYQLFENALPRWREDLMENHRDLSVPIEKLRILFDDSECRKILFFMFLCLKDKDPDRVVKHFEAYLLHLHSQVTEAKRLRGDRSYPHIERSKMVQRENIPLNISKALNLSSLPDVFALCQNFVLAYQAGQTERQYQETLAEPQAQKSSAERRSLKEEAAPAQHLERTVTFSPSTQVLSFDPRKTSQSVGEAVRNGEKETFSHKRDHRNMDIPPPVAEMIRTHSRLLDNLTRYFNDNSTEDNIHEFLMTTDGKTRIPQEEENFYNAALKEIREIQKETGLSFQEAGQKYLQTTKEGISPLLWPSSFYGIPIQSMDECSHNKALLKTIQLHMGLDEIELRLKYQELLKEQPPGERALSAENYQRILDWIHESASEVPQQIGQVLAPREKIFERCAENVVPTMFGMTLALRKLPIEATARFKDKSTETFQRHTYSLLKDELLMIGQQMLENMPIWIELQNNKKQAISEREQGILTQEQFEQTMNEIERDLKILERIIDISCSQSENTPDQFAESVRRDLLGAREAILLTEPPICFPDRLKLYLAKYHECRGGIPASSP